jgi:hypothetical protein
MPKRADLYTRRSESSRNQAALMAKAWQSHYVADMKYDFRHHLLHSKLSRCKRTRIIFALLIDVSLTQYQFHCTFHSISNSIPFSIALFPFQSIAHHRSSPIVSQRTKYSVLFNSSFRRPYQSRSHYALLPRFEHLIINKVRPTRYFLGLVVGSAFPPFGQ